MARGHFVLSLLLCTLAATALAPLANAAPTRVSWSLPGEVNEAAGIPISLHSSGVSAGQLVVQRQVGTAHAWQTVMRLRGKHGSAELPGLPLGEYRLRIAALSGKRRVLAQRVASIGVFGQVPLGELFKHGVIGNYTLPAATFPYVYTVDESFTVEHNHCDAMHFEFVPTGDHLTAGTATVLQQTRGPVSATAPVNAVGTLDVALVPGQSWTLRAEPIGGPIIHAPINGYGMCDSRKYLLG
jgi:hypothetical protein